MRAGELFVNIQSLSNAHILKPASNPVEANLRTFIDPAIGASMSVLSSLCGMIWFSESVQDLLLSKVFQLFCSGQFYWWRKLKYPEKTINMP